MEEKTKLTAVEAMDQIMETANDTQRALLRTVVVALQPANLDPRTVVAHSCMEVYRSMNDEEIKSCLRTIAKKYMNGARPLPTEASTCVKFLEWVK